MRLRPAMRTCLNLAVQHQAKTISFPAISTGVYGYPMEEAAPLAIQTIAGWLGAHNDAVHAVKLFNSARATTKSIVNAPKTCAEALRL